MSGDGRVIRRPRRPALFWTIATLCGLIAGGSVAFMAMRAAEPAGAEAAR